MLDHEEQFLFKEEILHLATSMAEPGMLDNVEDLLTDVITSPRFDSEVFTLERSLQVMLGARAGTTLVGLLTVSPEVFDQVAEVRIAVEVHERLVAWRARFGLAIDNALNFLNNPDGIQGHNFSRRSPTSMTAACSRAASRSSATTTSPSSSWPTRTSSRPHRRRPGPPGTALGRRHGGRGDGQSPEGRPRRHRAQGRDPRARIAGLGAPTGQASPNPTRCLPHPPPAG